MAISQSQLTLQEFLALPEKKPALEFENGLVTRKPVPKGKHSRLQRVLLDLLEQAGVAPGCAFPELRATFGGQSYVPDVAFYRWDRIPRDQGGQVADDFFEPPDLVVEILSPKQSVTALVRRCLWYVENGVAVALLVDPGDRSVLVFRPSQVPAALRGLLPIDLSDLLPGFDLTVQQLFDSLTVPSH